MLAYFFILWFFFLLRNVRNICFELTLTLKTLCVPNNSFFLLSTETICTVQQYFRWWFFRKSAKNICFLFLHNLKFLQLWVFYFNFFRSAIMCMDNKSICFLFRFEKKIKESMVDYVNICHDFYCSLISSIYCLFIYFTFFFNICRLFGHVVIKFSKVNELIVFKIGSTFRFFLVRFIYFSYEKKNVAFEITCVAFLCGNCCD